MPNLDDYFGGAGENDPNVNSRQDAMRVMVGSHKTTKLSAANPIIQVILPEVPIPTHVTIKGYLTQVKSITEHVAFTLVGIQVPASQVTTTNQIWGNAAGRLIDLSYDNSANTPDSPIRIKLGYTATKLPQIEFSGQTITTVGGGLLVIESIVYDGLTKENAPPPTLIFNELASSSIAGVTELATKNAANERHRHNADEITAVLLDTTTNLNTLKTPGKYYQQLALTTTWESLNYPFPPPCSIIIEKTNGVVQIAYGGESSPGAVALRALNSAGNFQAWSYEVNTDKKDLFIYRGHATSLEGENTRLPGHYDIDTGNSGPHPTVKGHMHVTSNGITTGATSLIQQTIFYHNGAIVTRRIVGGTGEAWASFYTNLAAIDNSFGMRVNKATNPFFEWHVPGVRAFMTYLDHTDGRLITGQSNGAATLSNFTHWEDNRGVFVLNGQLWSNAWAHSYATQYANIAPVHVDFGPVNGASDYYPIVRGKSSALGAGFTTQVELGMLRSANSWAQGILLVGSGEGSTPQAIYSFDISGNVNIPGEMSFTDYTIRCDKKFKTELAFIKDPLAKLDDVHGYTFINRQGEEDSGLVSNEWTWLPGATKVKPLTDEHGNLIEGESYISLRLKGPVGFMLECIKYQRTEIVSLTERLNYLEKLLGVQRQKE